MSYKVPMKILGVLPVVGQRQPPAALKHSCALGTCGLMVSAPSASSRDGPEKPVGMGRGTTLNGRAAPAVQCTQVQGSTCFTGYVPSGAARA